MVLSWVSVMFFLLLQQADSAHTAALEKENERLKNDLEALRNDLKPAVSFSMLCFLIHIFKECFYK